MFEKETHKKFRIENIERKSVTKEEDVNNLLKEFRDDFNILSGLLFLLKGSSEKKDVRINLRNKIITIMVKIRLNIPTNANDAEKITKVQLNEIEEKLQKIEKLVFESMNLENSEFIDKIDLALKEYTNFDRVFDYIVIKLQQYFSERIKKNRPTED